MMNRRQRRAAAMRETIEKQVVSEMIGRGGLALLNRATWNTANVSVDYTRADYRFWDRLRNGMEDGYRIGGLHARPMAEIIAAYVLGTGPKGVVKSDTPRDPDNPHPIEAALADFWTDNSKLITDWYFDGLTLGDGFLVVNPDTSLTPVQPSQVDLINDAIEWRQINQLDIKTNTGKATLTDSYTPQQRTITIQASITPVLGGTLPALSPVSTEQTQTFPNLIGRIPVAHFAHRRGANELTGRPYYAGLLTLFAEYDDVIRKSLNGVKIMGNPIPVIEEAEDTAAVITQNATGTTTYTGEDGTEYERPTIELTQDDHIMVLAKAKFNFKSPGQFTQDTARMLELLFLQMLQHAKIPEWVWGGAVNSSMASVSAQTPAFHAHIESCRQQFAPFLLELFELWLAMKALTEPGLILAEDESLVIEWPELTTRDEKFSHQKALDAYDRGLLTDATTLDLMELVPDATAEVEAASEQKAQRQDEFDQRLEDEMALERQRQGQAPPDTEPPERQAA